MTPLWSRRHRPAARFAFSPALSGLLALALTGVLLPAGSPQAMAAVAPNKTPPILSSMAMPSAPGTVPTDLTLTGTGFGSTETAGDSVLVDSLTASVITWSATSIEVSIPPGAGPGPVTVTTPSGTSNPLPWTGIERGYYTLSPDGAVTAHGPVTPYGGLLSIKVAATAVSLTETPDDKGYWILTSTGTVYGFGDAVSYGSPENITAVGMASTPSGDGYWVLAQNGAVYAFGSAVNYGNPSPTTAIGIGATADGQGYWVAAADGAVFPYGDAANDGGLITAPPTYANGTLLRQTGTNAIYLVIHGVLCQVPDLTTLRLLGRSLAEVHDVSSLTGEPTGPPLILPFPSGTVVDNSTTGTYFLDMSGVLRATTATVLNGMGLSVAGAVTVSTLGDWPRGPALLAPTAFAPSGSLWRRAGQPAIYVAVAGRLRQVASLAVLHAMGDVPADAQTVATLPALPIGRLWTTLGPVFPTGALVQQEGTPAIDVVLHGVLRQISTAAVGTLIGFDFAAKRVVKSLAGLPVGLAISAADIPPLPPIARSFQVMPNGSGYWMVGLNGVVHAFGEAPNVGSPTVGSSVLGIAPTPDGQGYLAYSALGAVTAFGDAGVITGPAGPTVSLQISAVPTTVHTLQSVGWGYFNTSNTTGPGGWYDLENEYQHLSSIAPDWFALGTDSAGGPIVVNYNPGQWTTAMMTKVTAFAQSHGVAVWPSVGWAAPGNLDLLRTAADRASIVSQMVNLAQSGGYNGMTIDFEGMGGTDATGGGSATPAYQVFNTFVAQLAAALHGVGKKLMVAVYAAPYPNTIYDYPALAASADYLDVMAYPEYTNGYPSNADAFPGPTSGYFWVQSLIQEDLATGVPASKLLLGLAPYGYYWTFSPAGFNANDSGYMSDEQQSQLVQQDQITPIWDPWDHAQIFTAGTPATTPTAPLTNNLTAPAASPAVMNLQAILDYVLIREAVSTGAPNAPEYLATDGWYGPDTTAAVEQFQTDFKVAGGATGVYNAATEAALAHVIAAWDVRDTTYWDETPESIANILGLVKQYNLGGVSPWRLGFESPGYWTQIANAFAVDHLVGTAKGGGQ